MKERILNSIYTLFTASLAFVAALAWNDAVQNLFNQIDYFQRNNISSRFIYAIFITIIAVIVSTVFARLLNRPEKDKIKMNDVDLNDDI